VSYAFFPSSRGDAAPLLNKNSPKDALREQVALDTEVFLKAGGKIKICEPGESAMDIGNKHLYLNKNSRAEELLRQKQFNIAGSRPRNMHS
tara:strand:- start:6349 stop:6621 length:273 start_codon:yes stop_codon:yes gene_type:complete